MTQGPAATVGTLDGVRAPLAVADVLALGVQLARALEALHKRGLVHAGVRPQAIEWDALERRAALLNSEGALAAPAPAALPAGADVARLVYVAPEQTARLDLPVDARSDLYALGVVLYEALTGTPPFVGADALQQIHWHIAGHVDAPAERDAAVPAPLSAITVRLLAKSPDERYQSAAGLVHDLEHCSAQWARQGRIEPFALAQRDRGARLVFSSRLVGREGEVARLHAAFERCCAGTRTLVLVEGYAGIGKTALIRQLYRPIVRRRGYFIAGKFDQVMRGVPFGALIEAFQGLVRQLLGESEVRLAHWRTQLLDALGGNAGVLTEVIPDIEHIVGAQPAPPVLDGEQALNRFQRVLQRFVGVLATAEHPLVLFLDDLQWADAATLALLEPLIAGPETGHVLLIGAFRDHDPATAPHLARTLRTLEAAGVPIERIALGPLAPDELAAWIADTLHGAGAGASERADAAPLAALVHEKTGGNPFFAGQFLRLLEREGHLRHDAARARWQCSVEDAARAPLADNVVDLMTRNIRRLPAPVQQLLTLAACIGNPFDAATLATVSERAEDDVARALAQAHAEGLVVHARGDGDFAFLHDRVQQSAYALIAPDRQREAHLAVGRLLRSRAQAQQLDAALFDIVHHLNLGRALIGDAAERRDVAALDLAAGRRAKSATAYDAALELFDAGVELLGTDGARADPALAFELQLGAAEARYLCGRFDSALAALDALVERAPTPIDRARVLRLRSVQYENLERYADAIRDAGAGLALFGVALPQSEPEQAAALEREIATIERLREGRPIAALAELPPMRDPATRMVMTMLTDVWSCAYLAGSPTLARLISATLVRLSLQHGNAEESAYGYVTHAITVGALRGELRAADDYGRLALAVNRRLDDRRLRAKIYQQFHAHVNFWCQPVRTCMAYAREACAAGLDSGDFLYAAYAAGTEPWSAIASTQDLAAFEREYAPHVALIERLKNPGFADSVRMLLAWARALQDRTQAPTSLTGTGFDEDNWLARYGEHRFFASIHAVARLQVAVLLGSADDALRAARRSHALIDAVPGTIWPLLHEFWHALALAHGAGAQDAERAAAVGADDAVRSSAVDALRAAAAAFAARVPFNAENHRGQALLLGAELARLEGHDADAVTACEQAVEFCATLPLRPLQALAHELLARAHARLERPALAAVHFTRARDLYATWGAHAKVAALESEHPSLAEATRAAPQPPEPQSNAATAAGPAPTDANLARDGIDTPGLDLGSLLKATQAIAGEVEFDRLLARLLHIAIENAGAERGALVLEGDSGPVVHAIDPDADAPSNEPLEGCERVPLAAIHLVRRTGKAVVAAEAAGEEPFADDAYVLRRRPRSLACLPLRRLGRAVGVLYVEHCHAGGVFTAARLATLQALATQAAISLENARLVAGLRSEVAERRAAQAELASALAEVERLKDELEAENSLLRRDLIANVSHDLRTPLQSMRGYLEVLAAKGDSLAAAQRRQYLNIAVRQSDRLAGLIDELFELAKLEFKGITLDRERFALAELAADVVQKFQLVAQGRSIELTVGAAPRLPFVDADLGLVERVLENLIGNALKHTPAGGRVHVQVSADDAGGVLVEVHDSGTGVAPEDLPHIFERLYRGAAGRTQSDGAGLGLAIARRIVELHGGEIGAGSPPGEGTRMWFSLGAAAA